MMFFGIISACAAVMCLFLIFFYFKHMKTAINVIDASAEFMVGNKRVALIPIVYFIIKLLVMLLWVYCMTAIISLNVIVSTQNKIGDGYSPQTKIIEWNAATTFMVVFMCVGIVWV